MSDDVSLLIDGSTPATPDQVEQQLHSLEISFSTILHAPMFTVEDSREHRNGVTGGYSKNLFLRNKKGHMWLVTLCEDRVIDLKELGRIVGAGRVSFASKERLMGYLGVISGAVTPLAVINDSTRSVNVVLDEQLLDKDPLHFHPCDNTMTTTLNRDGLLRYLTESGHSPTILNFDA